MTEATSAALSPRAPDGVRRALEIWHRAECWLAVVAFGFIAAILTADVFGREVVGPVLNKLGIDIGPTGIFASQRLSIYALVIGSFAGIGIATATASHLVPRVGFGWSPKSWASFIDRLADVVTGLFLLCVVYFGIVFVLSTKAADLRAPVLEWVVWPMQTAIPLGFASAALRYFAYARWPDLRPQPPEFQE